MKNIKKLTVLILALSLIFCFVSCQNAETDNETESVSSTGVSETESAESVVASELEEESDTLPEEETEEESSSDFENTTADNVSEETEAKTEETTEQQTEATTNAEAEKEVFNSVSEAMQNMTLEERVGQLFIVMPEAIDKDEMSKRIATSSIVTCHYVSDGMREVYAKYPAGGFILFGANITNGTQLKKYTADLHSLGRIRPFVCIDEEGGNVARIANSGTIQVQKFGNMQSVAETGNTSKAYAVGSGIGQYLKEYGIDLDFAPVADVNTNPDNPVIGKRAFGSNPEVAGKMVASVINGLHSQGVKSCIKHFPGHGDTQTDTHVGYAETLKTWDEIKNCEMVPFVAGINAGTDTVMAAHIAAPNVTGDSTPATLSYTLITEKLRNELGFNGVIITDSMSMNAVSSRYTPAEAAKKAFKAGVDIILIPDNYIEAFNGILSAVKSGEISEERLNASVKRILTMKFEG